MGCSGVRQRAWTTSDCTGEKGNGDKCCKMGQGDCDWDSDCCDGLKCGFDWGWATDVCVSGPTTKNFTWTDWTEWSDCSVRYNKCFYQNNPVPVTSLLNSFN